MLERRQWSARLRALMAIASLSASAHAAEKDVCIAAANEGQDLRGQSRLIAAREQFLACVRPECPALIRKACADWFADVDARVPSVVFGARDARGKDLVEVRVYVDGALVRASLDGTATPINPGLHRVRFEYPPEAPVETELVAREGEKNRPVITMLGREHHAPSPAPSPSVRRSGSAAAPALGVGAAGLLVLGGALFLGFRGRADIRDLRVECGGRCATDDVDAARTKLFIADIGLVIAALAIGASGYMLISARRDPD